MAATYTTLKDIAKEIGVSVTTISKVINNHPDISQTRRKQVLKLMEKKNYVPNVMAANLRRRKSKFIGFVISDNTNPYYARLLKGVEETLSMEGYQVIIFNTNENVDSEREFIKSMLAINVAGVIITPAQGNRESVDILKKFEIPYVITNRYLDKGEDNYVAVDDEEIGYIATNHLLTRKPDVKVIYINGNQSISSSVDRKHGYLRALSERGIKNGMNMIYEDIMDIDSSYAIARKIFKSNTPPLSILCYSDYVAMGILQYLNENKIKIPDEVALMGIDDVEYASFTYPKLSTVTIPQKNIGIESARLLMTLIKDKDRDEEHPPKASEQIILSAGLVVRESS